MRRLFLIIALLVSMMPSVTYCQSAREATKKGSVLISGTASFASQGGELYEFNAERFYRLSLSPSLLYFVMPGFGVGLDFNFSRLGRAGESLVSTGIGPQAGLFFEINGGVIPFIGGGVSHLSVGSDDERDWGVGFNLGVGAFIRKGHLAAGIEVNYVFERFKPEGFAGAITGNTILVGIGLAGFLYK